MKSGPSGACPQPVARALSGIARPYSLQLEHSRACLDYTHKRDDRRDADLNQLKQADGNSHCNKDNVDCLHVIEKSFRLVGQDKSPGLSPRTWRERVKCVIVTVYGHTQVVSCLPRALLLPSQELYFHRGERGVPAY
eukprot:SAG31_NODE_5228_length_2662_cov_1.697620_4_plen_137_part_00